MALTINSGDWNILGPWGWRSTMLAHWWLTMHNGGGFTSIDGRFQEETDPLSPLWIPIYIYLYYIILYYIILYHVILYYIILYYI